MWKETERWCATLTLTVHDYSTMARMGWFADDILSASKQSGWDLMTQTFDDVAAKTQSETGVRIEGVVTQSHIESDKSAAAGKNSIKWVRFWIRGVRLPDRYEKDRYRMALDRMAALLRDRFPRSEVGLDVAGSAVFGADEERKPA